MAKKPSKRREAQVVRAILLAALGKFADQQGDRDAIPGGIACDVDVEITGTVDNEDVQEFLNGTLTVNHNSLSAQTSACDMNQLVAYLLFRMPASTIDKLLDELPASYAAGGELPAVPEELVGRAKRLLGQLRQSKQIEKRGSVGFVQRPAVAEAAH